MTAAHLLRGRQHGGAAATQGARAGAKISLGKCAGAVRRQGIVRGQKGDGGFQKDWDAAWSKYKSKMLSQVDVDPSVDENAPKVKPLNEIQRGIRRQESAALNVWHSETFMKVGAVTAAALLFALIILVGPPSSDGRCTLPWC